MIGFFIFGLVLTCAQSYHGSLHQRRLNDPNWAVNSPIQPWEAKQQQTYVPQAQQTYVAQPTWNAQPQQYTAQNSASLHQRRLNDPNWAVNSPIQAWEAAYNGPAPVPTYSQPQATYQQPKVAVHQPQAPTFTQPQAVAGQRPGNVLWAVKDLHQQRLSDPLWAIKAKKPSEDPLWALNAHQKAAFLHG